MKKEGIELTPQLFQTFKAGRVIKEHNKDIVGLDFSNDGTFLYSADSTTLNIFETRQGKMIRKLFMKTHEIQQLSHTHHNHGVLVATKKGHMILYWSIHDNKVIKAFEGHKDTITGLMMCPSDDKFISTSQDNTIRLWDLSSNSKECLYIVDVEKENVSTNPVASFDPDGVIFAAGWSEQPKDRTYARICLFSIANCVEKGAFEDWKLMNYSEIKLMKFSSCGNLILLGTSDNLIILLDAFKGEEKYKLTNFINEASIIECSFTPDTKYILSGSQNGVIHVWSIDGKEVVQLKSHVEKVFFVKFSTTNCLMVSGGRNVIWWVPELQSQ